MSTSGLGDCGTEPRSSHRTRHRKLWSCSSSTKTSTRTSTWWQRWRRRFRELHGPRKRRESSIEHWRERRPRLLAKSRRPVRVRRVVQFEPGLRVRFGGVRSPKDHTSALHSPDPLPLDKFHTLECVMISASLTFSRYTRAVVKIANRDAHQQLWANF